MPTKDLARPRTKATSKGGPSGGRAAAHSQAPPNLVSSDGVLALQQTAGNMAVQRAMAVQRDDDLLPPVDNPLVGLKAQDGLDFGTFETRPRVKLLQTKLNEKTGSSLSVDGMWGKKTTAALESFQLGQSMVPVPLIDQATGDALMGRSGGGGGGGGGGKQPPDLGRLFFNQALEARFDAIDEKYGELLARQGEALSQFRNDLGDPEKKQPGLLGDLVIRGANFVIDNTLGTGSTSLRLVAETTTKAALAALPNLVAENTQGQVVDNAVTKPFTAAVDKGKEVVRETVAPSTTAASIADFVDVQHAAQISSHRDAVRQFHQSKPGLRQFTDNDVKVLSSQPIPGMIDPRLDRAQAVLDGVEASVRAAKPKTYGQVTASWATMNARRGLMEHGSFRTDVTDVGQLQDASATSSVLGVLEAEITFDPNDGRKPVAVKQLHIAGLSPKVRGEITKGSPGPLVGELGFPIRARGSEGGGIFGGSTEVAVAAPEDRSQPEKVNKGNNSADAYYAQKGGGNADDILAMFRGIAKVISEVDRVRVKEVPGELQGP